MKRLACRPAVVTLLRHIKRPYQPLDPACLVGRPLLARIPATTTLSPASAVHIFQRRSLASRGLPGSTTLHRLSPARRRRLVTRMITPTATSQQACPTLWWTAGLSCLTRRCLVSRKAIPRILNRPGLNSNRVCHNSHGFYIPHITPHHRLSSERVPRERSGFAAATIAPSTLAVDSQIIHSDSQPFFLPYSTQRDFIYEARHDRH